MKNFIVYLENGQILRTGTCVDEDFEIQGEYVVEGIADDAKQYISNQAVIDLPPKPNRFYLFNYNTKHWEFDSVNAAAETRSQRNALLAMSDWTDTLSAKNRLGQELYDQWQTYRQALRDITDQPDYPRNVIWPTPPQ